jgi:uncharacterized membrane protein
MSSSSSTQTGLFKNVKRTFITGLFAALPLTLTIIAIAWLAQIIHRFLGPSSDIGKLLEKIGLNFFTSEISAYIFGIFLVLAVVYLLGLLVEAGMKNRWYQLIDSLLNQVPLVRTVYNTLSKVTKMFDRSGQEDIKSMSAVVCFFGGNKHGTATLALLTSQESIHLNGQDYYAVMIPTAPIPFGGAILYVPVEWVEKADFDFNGLLNIYMSMGVTSPDYFRDKPAPDINAGKS